MGKNRVIGVKAGTIFQDNFKTKTARLVISALFRWEPREKFAGNLPKCGGYTPCIWGREALKNFLKIFWKTY